MSIRPDTLGRKWQRTRLGFFENPPHKGALYRLKKTYGCEAEPVIFVKLFSLWLVRALYPCSAKARGFFTDFSFGFWGYITSRHPKGLAAFSFSACFILR